MENRSKMGKGEVKMDWGFGELLGFGTLLDDGIANELFTADARFNKIFQFLIRVVINPLQVHPVGGTKTIQSD